MKARGHSLLTCVLAFAAAAAFFPVLRHGYVNWDDPNNFLMNADYRGFGGQYWTWAWTTTLLGVYQPLAWLLFQVEYSVGGPGPQIIHAVSLFLHAVNTAVLYRLCLRLVAAARGPAEGRLQVRRRALGVAIPVLIFAVHPLRTEVVAWASCQPYLLAAFFSLLCVGAYLKAVEREDGARPSARWWAAVYVSFLAALLSKASVIPLPAVLLALNVYPLRRFGVQRLPRWGRVVLPLLPLAVMAVPFALVALMSKQEVVARGALLSAGGRIAAASQAILFYLAKGVWPHPLLVFYGHEGSPGLTQARYLFALVVVLGVSAAALMWRRRAPAFFICWGSYLALLAPTLGLVAASEYGAADRYSYLSQLPWVVLACGVSAAFIESDRIGERVRVACSVGVVTLAMGLGVASWWQCGLWADSKRLWEHAYRHAAHPSSYVCINLGQVAATQGRYQEALGYFLEGLQALPAGSRLEERLQWNAAASYASLGRWPNAIPHFQRAVDLAPTYPDYRRGLADALMRVNRRAEAKVHFEWLRSQGWVPRTLPSTRN